MSFSEKHFPVTKRIVPLRFQDTYEHGLIMEKYLLRNGYLAQYVNSVLETINPKKSDKSNQLNIVLGICGDDFSKEAAKIILQVCAANNVYKVCTARYGMLSLPMVSLLLKNKTEFCLGFFFGSCDYRGDADVLHYCLRCLIEDGRLMNQNFKKKVNAHFSSSDSYSIVPGISSNFEFEENFLVGENFVCLTLINPANDYLAHIKNMFEFKKIQTLLQGDFPREPLHLLIDCRNGAAGPLVKEIFTRQFGLRAECIYNAHPKFKAPRKDRNLEENNCWFIKSKLEETNSQLGVTFNADGTMCLLFGHYGYYVSKTEIMAIIALHIHCIPFFQRNPSKAFGTPYTTYMALKASNPGSITVIKEMCFDLQNVIEELANYNICLYADADFGMMTNNLRVPDGIATLLCLLTVLDHTRKPMKQIALISRRFFDQAYEARLYYDNVDPSNAANVEKELTDIFHHSDCDLKKRIFGEPPYQFVIQHVTLYIKNALTPRIIFEDGSRIAYSIRQKTEAKFEVIIYVTYNVKVKRKRETNNLEVGLNILCKMAIRLASLHTLVGEPSHTYYF